MLQVEPRKYSIYREAAVDAITAALDESVKDESVQEKCCRALLILGGRLSLSGELVTESWILKQAGFNEYGCEVNSLNNEENDLLVHDSIDLVCNFCITIYSVPKSLQQSSWLKLLNKNFQVHVSSFS